MKKLPLALSLISLLTTALHAERPNVILVMADDQGWGDTGYNGHPVVKTPNLDAMAKDGLVFNLLGQRLGNALSCEFRCAVDSFGRARIRSPHDAVRGTHLEPFLIGAFGHRVTELPAQMLRRVIPSPRSVWLR